MRRSGIRRRRASGVTARLFALLLWATAGMAAGAPTVDDYQRSLELREEWMTLTRDLPFPARSIGGSQFVYRKTVEGGFAFVLFDARTRRKQPAFDHARIARALEEAGAGEHSPTRLPFETLEFIDDASAISVRIDERNWICRLQTYACEAAAESNRRRPRGFGVVRDLRAAADNTPRRSPDGRREAFVQGDDVAIRELSSGETFLLTDDGHAEDFHDPETLAWSPDSRRLAVHRVRPGFARQVLRVETSPRDQLQPRVQTQLYPKPGDAVDIERPVLFDIEARSAIVIDDTLFANPYRLSPIRWRRDSGSFSFDYVERGHQRVRLIEVDADTGRTRAAVDESSDSFVHVDRGFRHEVDGLGDEIIWSSERDGWRHLYLVDGRSGEARQITRGEWIVRQVVKVDDAQRRIWFAASGVDAGSDPYLQHYFSVDFDGGNLTRLTHADAWHDVAFSEDMQYYLDTWSRVDLPPVSELRRADGSLVMEVERADIGALEAAGWRPPEVFVAKGRDGATDIWGLVVRPRDHDPARTYPVVENIYAGPHDSFVPKTFWPFGYHSGGDKVIGMQAQADLGFIVVQIDGMGTANRSKAFHDVAWKNLADSGFPDRIAWHRAFAAQDASYDASRVGIYGASAGGQSSLNALLFHPDFYRVAVAYVGCYDNRMDKISWNEQWLGWPVDDSYAAASGVDHAWRLQGDLLLIVGEQDSNVDPASTMQVVDALVRAGKDFDLLNVPGEGHAVGRSTGPIDYVQRRQFDFFVRHLAGQQTPRWNAVPAVADR